MHLHPIAPTNTRSSTAKHSWRARLLRVGGDLQAQSLKTDGAPRRPREVQAAAAQRAPPGVGALAQVAVRDLATGDDAVEVGGVEAHLGQVAQRPRRACGAEQQG